MRANGLYCPNGLFRPRGGLLQVHGFEAGEEVDI